MGEDHADSRQVAENADEEAYPPFVPILANVDERAEKARAW